jgi:hypothetical protein
MSNCYSYSYERNNRKCKTNYSPETNTLAYPIAQKLQKYHYKLAIQWAVECIQIYASEVNPDKLFQLNKYMQQAMEEQNSLTASQCLEISTEIWYLPDREDIQTAISRMWASISAFKVGEEHGGIMETTAAVELVLPDISDSRLLNRYLKAAMKICEEYESQNQTCE